MKVFRGFGDAANHFGALASANTDFRDPLNAAATACKANAKRRFNQEIDPNGDKWEPLAKSTIKRRRKRSRKPLQDSGTLRKSIETKRAIGAVFDLEMSRVEWGSRLPYAAAQHYGTKTIPQRPFVGFSKEDEAEIHKIFNLWLARIHENGKG